MKVAVYIRERGKKTKDRRPRVQRNEWSGKSKVRIVLKYLNLQEGLIGN